MGITLWIILETVEGLISNINARVSKQGYFLSHRNVSNTLWMLESFEFLFLCLCLPLLFRRDKLTDTLVVICKRVSGSSPVFNQNRSFDLQSPQIDIFLCIGNHRILGQGIA